LKTFHAGADGTLRSALFSAAGGLLALLACTVPTIDVTAARQRMVEEQLVARGIRDEAVLAAMQRTHRHRFLGDDMQRLAYADHPLPIGHGATISQPYIVALMTELARVRPGARVLDVGTGSGYQAAVLAELGADVDSIELVPELAERASERLRELGYERVRVRTGDGSRGLPERAPFAAIIVAAATPVVPPALQEQLAVGGRLIIPVGRDNQELTVIERKAGGFSQTTVIPVRFVALRGEAEALSR